MMHKKNIVWLASYPKSGNTWMRAILSALYNGKLNINNINIAQKFSSRYIVEKVSDINTRYLYDDEAKELQKEVFTYLSHHQKDLFIKIHDSYNSRYIPVTVTKCAIYIVRNPLDIAASLANHINKTIEEAINNLCNENYCFGKQENNLNISYDFRQYLSTWNNHVNSWVNTNDIPVLVIRYEDLLDDTFTEVKKYWHLPVQPILVMNLYKMLLNYAVLTTCKPKKKKRVL